MNFFVRWKLKRAMRNTDFARAAQQVAGALSDSVNRNDLAHAVDALIARPNADTALALVEIEPACLPVFLLCDRRLPELRLPFSFAEFIGDQGGR